MTGLRHGRTPETPNLITWDARRLLWRVSRDPTGLAFSVSERSSRFSPLREADGSIVPAWYGASSRAGAIFESVFHDIRPAHAAPRVLPNQYADRILAPVVTARPLVLVDLTSTGLQAIGVSRRRLIESTSRAYDFSREIAARLRAVAGEAEGFVWVSRAHDTSQSVVLYALPGRPPLLEPGPPSEQALPLGIGAGLELLRELAITARITVVVPGA